MVVFCRDAVLCVSDDNRKLTPLAPISNSACEAKRNKLQQLGHTTPQGAGAWSLSLSKCSEILHTKVSRKGTKSQRNTIIGLNGHVVYNNDKKIWNVSCLLKMRIEGQLHRSCRYKALPLQYGKS